MATKRKSIEGFTEKDKKNKKLDDSLVDDNSWDDYEEELVEWGNAELEDNDTELNNSSEIDEWADWYDDSDAEKNEELNDECSKNNSEYINDTNPLLPRRYILGSDNEWHAEVFTPSTSLKAAMWLNPECLQRITDWARDYPLKGVAKKMGISPDTLSRWGHKYPEIRNALRIGVEALDYEIENKLIDRAKGMKTTRVRQMYDVDKTTGEKILIREELQIEELQPDMTAITFYLNNRNRDKWLRNRDSAIELTDDQSKLVVNIVSASQNQDIANFEVEEYIPQSNNQSNSGWEDDDAWN